MGRAAPIAARYVEVRRDDLSSQHRNELWGDFCSEFISVGLYQRGGWAHADFDEAV